MSISTNIEYKITKILPSSIVGDRFLSTEDRDLINPTEEFSSFDIPNTRIESHIYSLDNVLLKSFNSTTSEEITFTGSTVQVNPEISIKRNGFEQGDVKIIYNFLNRRIRSENSLLFIESISPDRTEIRAVFNDIDLSEPGDLVRSNRKVNLTLRKQITDLIQQFNSSTNFPLVHINFGDNILLPIINIDIVPYKSTEALAFKLYRDLPEQIQEKAVIQVEEEVLASQAFEIIGFQKIPQKKFTSLRKPNFDVKVQVDSTKSTELTNIDDLFDLEVNNNFFELKKIINSNDINLSIDYSDFNNFINLSSIVERLNNFVYKLKLIEKYQSKIENTTNNSIIKQYEQKIKSITDKFDHYEDFLFFEKSEDAWPKQTSKKPHILYKTDSTEGINWLESKLEIASIFDDQNNNLLLYSIPQYIREDSSNTGYFSFIHMIGHYFDNIWIYAKKLQDRYNTDNRLDKGISRELVKHAVESFGINLYTSSSNVDNLLEGLIGASSSTGSLNINEIRTITEDTPLSDQQPLSKNQFIQEIYKRVYHNIPLLLKAKGTERGLRSLINCFGIPSDILEIKLYQNINSDRDLQQRPDIFTTSSEGKIYIEDNLNTSFGTSLNKEISIQPIVLRNTDSDNIIKIGFSPIRNVDRYILSTFPSGSCIDDIIGDPRNLGTDSYVELQTLSRNLLQGNIEPLDSRQFINLLRYYDSSLFRIIKDFVPFRASIHTGLLVDSHILDRSKYKGISIDWNKKYPSITNEDSNLDYIGDLYPENFSKQINIDVQDFKKISGQSGGMVPKNYDTSDGRQATFTGEFKNLNKLQIPVEVTSNNIFKKPLTQDFTTFQNSGFNSKYGNIHSNRKSKYSITGDISKVPSTINPAEDYINLNSIPSFMFVEKQDSMDFDTGWVNSRYKGSLNKPFFLGNEPFLSYSFFRGAIFQQQATEKVIENIFEKTFDTSDIESLYYVTYIKQDSIEGGTVSFSGEMLTFDPFGTVTYNVKSLLVPKSSFSDIIIQAPTVGKNTTKVDYFKVEEATIIFQRQGNKYIPLPNQIIYDFERGMIYNTGEFGIVIDMKSNEKIIEGIP